jgi:cytochrome c biogenesis protein CcdA
LLRTTLVVAAIALADSLNPSTVVPAVYLTFSPSPTRQVLEFTAGVFTANLVCGVLLLLGPGQLLLDALPHPSPHQRHLLELAGGGVLIAVALAVWLARHRLAKAPVPGSGLRKGSGFVAGAALMLAEFPTAFPYFGAIALIVGSHASLPVQLLMVAMFNLLFVAPLIAIAVLVAVLPGVRTTILEPAAAWLTQRWPKIFALLALALGVGLVVAGSIGLTRD